VSKLQSWAGLTSSSAATLQVGVPKHRSAEIERGVLVSSAIPSEIDRFARYAQRWIDLGFAVVTLNAASEAPRISTSALPFKVLTAAQSFEGRYGKPVVGIAEALRTAWQLAPPGGLFGVMNSDIYPSRTGDICRTLDAVKACEAHIFARLDICSGEPGQVWPHGFDLVLLRKQGLLPCMDIDDDFAFGIPWWDVWLPLCLHRSGYRVVANSSGLIWHDAHEQRYPLKLWQEKRTFILDKFLPSLNARTITGLNHILAHRATWGGNSDHVLGDSIIVFLKEGPPGPLRRIARSFYAMARSCVRR
jgi:hypothetical protein